MWCICRAFNIKAVHIFIMLFYKPCCQLVPFFMVFISTVYNFIIYIRKVFNESYIIAFIFKKSSNYIKCNRTSAMANMCVIINCNTAYIHAYFSFMYRAKLLFFRTHCVVKHNAHYSILHLNLFFH